MENSDSEEPNSACRAAVRRCWHCSQQNTFLAKCLLAVGLGIGLGTFLNIYVHLTELDQHYICFPGLLLVGILKAAAVPLILTRAITSVAALHIETCRRITVRGMLYFASVTLLSVIIGLVVVLTFEPGVAAGMNRNETEGGESFFTVEASMNLMRDIIPKNMMAAFYQKINSEWKDGEIEQDEQNSTLVMNVTRAQPEKQYVEGVNTLGLTVLALSAAVYFNIFREGQTILSLFSAFNSAINHVIDSILWYFPVGSLFLIVNYVFEGHVLEIIIQLGMFVAVVILGLIIHSAIVSFFFVLAVRRNPLTMIRGIFPALQTALVKSSSSATLPVTKQCCEEHLNIDQRITGFMLPVGTIIAIGGTSLYKVAAAIFIAQYHGIFLDFHRVFTLFVAAVMSSIGAGIPDSGALTTIYVLSAADLPMRDIALLVIAECLLDHLNTVVTVLGHCVGVTLVHHFSRKDLEDMLELGQEMTRMHDGDAEGHIGLQEIQIHAIRPEIFSGAVENLQDRKQYCEEGLSAKVARGHVSPQDIHIFDVSSDVFSGAVEHLQDEDWYSEEDLSVCVAEGHASLQDIHIHVISPEIFIDAVEDLQDED